MLSLDWQAVEVNQRLVNDFNRYDLVLEPDMRIVGVNNWSDCDAQILEDEIKYAEDGTWIRLIVKRQQLQNFASEKLRNIVSTSRRLLAVHKMVPQGALDAAGGTQDQEGDSYGDHRGTGWSRRDGEDDKGPLEEFEHQFTPLKVMHITLTRSGSPTTTTSTTSPGRGSIVLTPTRREKRGFTAPPGSGASQRFGIGVLDGAVL